EKVYKGKIDTWDYQWTFSCWIQNTLTVLPNRNLVSNIGFGMKAVHTTEKNKFSNMKTEPITFPISHPPYILRDSVADNITEKTNFSGKLLKKGIIEIIRIIRGTFK
ncbi:MAG: glycosyltransferase family 2 protein, partial [Chloroflexota bacterium]|nr:glycosyltransferase family 2 protein [Chloroflexota bacterium]